MVAVVFVAVAAATVTAAASFKIYNTVPPKFVRGTSTV